MQPLNPLLTQNFPVIAAFLVEFVDLAKSAQIERNPLFFSDAVVLPAAAATSASVASSVAASLPSASPSAAAASNDAAAAAAAVASAAVASQE